MKPNPVKACVTCYRSASPGDDLCAKCRELLEAAGVVRMDRGPVMAGSR